MAWPQATDYNAAVQAPALCFADADLQIFEPFPKKGNLVVRMKGDGSKKPLLLLAHLDVVEALRGDWQTDPFVLQETDGFFTARGSIDD